MTTVTVEAGPQNARSDPETGMRYYTWQDRRLVSVTSIRRMAGVPFNLVQWQISRIVGRAVGRVDSKTKEFIPGRFDELTAMMTRERKPRERVLEKNRAKEAGTWLRAAATEERDAAAALGTAVHDAAAQGLTPADLPEVWSFRKDGVDVGVLGEEMKPRLAQYLDWLEVSGMTLVLSERQAFNLTLGYAGSFDLIARARDGSLWLIDIKTGKGTYSDHVLQALAYLMAEFIGSDDVVDEGATQLLHRVSGIAILHLADEGWEFIEPVADPEAWGAFRGLLRFATWTAAHDSPESFTVASRSGQDVEAAA